MNKIQFVFIIRYNGQSWNTHPALQEDIVRITGVLLRRLIFTEQLPVEQYGIQLTKCKDHIRSVRIRMKDEIADHQHTIDIENALKGIFGKTKKQPKYIIPDDADPKDKKSYRSLCIQDFKAGKAPCTFEYFMEFRKGGCGAQRIRPHGCSAPDYQLYLNYQTRCTRDDVEPLPIEEFLLNVKRKPRGTK